MLRFGVADVTLSALVKGEYVLELSLVKNGTTDVVASGFRIILNMKNTKDTKSNMKAVQ